MAGKSSAAAAVDPAPQDWAAPGNFEDVTTPDIEGWLIPAEGVKFMGQCLARIQIENDDGKMRDVVLVKLEKPCASVKVDGEMKTLEAGQVLGVGLSWRLQELLHYVEKKGRVYVEFTGKQKLKQGRSMWKTVIKGEKGKKAPPPPPISRAAAATAGDGEDAGF